MNGDSIYMLIPHNQCFVSIRDAIDRERKAQEQAEELWSKDVCRLKQAVEHCMAAQSSAEAVAEKHQAEVTLLQFNCRFVVNLIIMQVSRLNQLLEQQQAASSLIHEHNREEINIQRSHSSVLTPNLGYRAMSPLEDRLDSIELHLRMLDDTTTQQKFNRTIDSSLTMQESTTPQEKQRKAIQQFQALRRKG